MFCPRDKSVAIDEAITFGHVEALKDIYLEEGVVLDTNMMIKAVNSGHVKILTFLLEKGGNPNDKDVNGSSLLHLATVNNDTPMVTELILQGAYYDEFNGERKRPQDLATGVVIKYLFNLISSNFKEVEGSVQNTTSLVQRLKNCLQKDLLVSMFARNRSNRTIFQLAIYRNSEIVKDLADLKVGHITNGNLSIEEDANFVSFSRSLLSPLLELERVSRDDEEEFRKVAIICLNLMKLLLEYSQLISKSKTHLLHCHIIEEILQVFDIGQDPDSLVRFNNLTRANNSNYLVILFSGVRKCVENQSDKSTCNIFTHCAYENDPSYLIADLWDPRIQGAKDRLGRSPFQIALHRGSMLIVKWMLSEVKVDPTLVSNYFQYNSLHFAVDSETHKSNEVILDQVIHHIPLNNLCELINAYNSAGYTPLHLAVMNDNLAAVRILCRHGARYNAPDREGKEPASFAKSTCGVKEFFNQIDHVFEQARDGDLKFFTENPKKFPFGGVMYDILNTRDRDGKTAFSIVTSKNVKRYSGHDSDEPR